MTKYLDSADQAAVVVTTINPPTPAMRILAAGCLQHGANLIVVGDTKSPPEFNLEGARFYDVASQIKMDLRFARACPTRHYARKNIGYLLAMMSGARLIIETDDDNAPTEGFWETRKESVSARVVRGAGWVNAYGYFSGGNIWPRGLPLDVVQAPLPELSSVSDQYCPIQQGLANGNPDVDAIYRLILPLPLTFDVAAPVVLQAGSWCPFNSQNTTFFPAAFPLLYLPYHCSFRMTDIWRSFVAQAILHVNGCGLLFHKATVFQDRNEHDLMRDFADEVVGYLNNRKIMDALVSLPLRSGFDNMGDNLRVCYEKLVSLGVVGQGELPLLDAWLDDIGQIKYS